MALMNAVSPSVAVAAAASSPVLSHSSSSSSSRAAASIPFLHENRPFSYLRSSSTSSSLLSSSRRRVIRRLMSAAAATANKKIRGLESSSEINGSLIRRRGCSSAAFSKSSSSSSALLPAALLFDCDGVLVDTEKDGHRISFNNTFQEAIYNLAATTLDVDPSSCVVVEDSAIGLAAAKAAGMKCIVTKSGYTAEEDFLNADAVFDCIGDPPQEHFDLAFCGSLLQKQSVL